MSALLALLIGVPFLGLLLLSVLWYKKYNYAFGGLKHIKGPLCLPILGNATRLGSATNIFWTFYNWFDQFGQVAKGAFGFIMMIGIVDPEVIEFVCTSPKTIVKGIPYRFLHKWLSQGLLTSMGEKWRSMRKLLTPTYHFKILEQFLDLFEKNGNILIGKLRPKVDVHHLVYSRLYTPLGIHKVILETVMGTTFNAQDSQHTDYVNAIKEMTRIIIEPSFWRRVQGVRNKWVNG